MAFLRGTEDYLRADLEHFVHPISVVGESTGIVFAEGDGIMLRDTEGREYIDATAGAMNVNIGHGRTELAEAAMLQMRKLAYTTTFRGNTHTAVIECAQKLADLTPEGLKHFFFCCGGSEAVETCLKVARFYWRNKGVNKYKFISLYGAYHGAAYGATSATGMSRMWQNYEPLVPGFIHIPRYYCYRCDFGLTYPNCDIRCARFLEDVIKQEGEDSVAAFIAEPVQGAGGMIPPPPEYWPIVREICTRRNVLLITDEVITGFGRTGRLFAVEHWGVQPDLMAMAKGITSGYLPFGAAALSQEVYETLKAAGTPLTHLFTYSGHPVCCAVAIKNMEILVEENLAQNAARVGQYMLSRLQELTELPCVAGLGGLGLTAGFELVADKASKTPVAQAVKDEVVLRAREKGLLIRLFGERLGLSPPLIVTPPQIDRIMEILKPVIASVVAR